MNISYISQRASLANPSAPILRYHLIDAYMAREAAVGTGNSINQDSI